MKRQLKASLETGLFIMKTENNPDPTKFVFIMKTTLLQRSLYYESKPVVYDQSSWWFISSFIINQESEINRELVYECRCDKIIKGKAEGSTRLGYTGLSGGLEHLKIETRLRDERFASVMGEYVFLKW